MRGGRSVSFFRAFLIFLLLAIASTPSLCRPNIAQPTSDESASSASPQQSTPQEPNNPTPAQTEPAKAAEKKKKKESRGSIVVAPLPLSSPAIGSGIIPVVGYIFPISKKDTVSPPSVVGGAGLITNNGSRGFAVGADLYMLQDTYRITTGFLRGNIDYNIYGDGIASELHLPLVQTGHVFSLIFCVGSNGNYF